METRNPLLADWLQDAYGMELGLAQALEGQIHQLPEDSDLRRGISQHLQATHSHADLLRRRLLDMGANTRTVEPRALPLAGFFTPGSDGVDIAMKTGLVDFVNESFEIASYQALAALASQLGDQETADVCQQILRDEMAMADALDRFVPHTNGHSSTGSAIPAGTAVSQEQRNIQTAQANYDAINAHDVDRWLALTTQDFEGEAPGTSGPMTREQNQEYLRNYISAFPDLHFHVLRIIAQGEFVGVDWYATGTHKGPMHGPKDMVVPATGREATEYGHNTFEFRDGKIFRAWTYFDLAVLMQQLGLMPAA